MKCKIFSIMLIGLFIAQTLTAQTDPLRTKLNSIFANIIRSKVSFWVSCLSWGALL